MQTGVNVEAAAQPDLSVQQPVQEAPQEQFVPLSALQAERRERQQLQENVKMMQDHLALLQANQVQQTKKKDEFENLQDNDVLTVGEAKKFVQSLQREQQMAVEELKMSTQHPDYNEVVRKYLPEVLKSDPELVDMIKNAPNPYKAAYFIAKRSDNYLQDQRTQTRSPEAQKATQNLQRAGNLSSAGNGVSGSAAGNYKAMSDGDFQKLVNKNLGYI